MILSHVHCLEYHNVLITFLIKPQNGKKQINFEGQAFYGFPSSRVIIIKKLKLSKTIPKTALLKLYTCYIRSVLEYGSVIYDNCSMSDSNKLEKTQMRAVKIILGCFRTNISSQSTLTDGFAPFKSSSQNKPINVFFFYKMLKTALLRRISAAPRGAVIAKNVNLLYFLTFVS